MIFPRRLPEPEHSILDDVYSSLARKSFFENRDSKTYVAGLEKVFGNMKDREMKIVEVGSSVGLTSMYLADYFSNSQIIGIEPNAENVAFAKENVGKGHENLEFINDKVEDTSVSGADLVFCFDTLHHMDLETYENSINSILRLGGAFYLHDLDRDESAKPLQKNDVDKIKMFRKAYGDAGAISYLLDQGLTSDRSVPLITLISVMASYTRNEVLSQFAHYDIVINQQNLGGGRYIISGGKNP